MYGVDFFTLTIFDLLNAQIFQT